MDFATSFTRAAASLPDATRTQLDGDAPLDWTALEDPATGVRLAEAVGERRRLPEPVEKLVQRLVRAVGIVPADVVAGLERQKAASGWIRRIALEADGECYRTRNHLNGEVCECIRPEAIAGYAVFAMELATAVQQASDCWIEAGDRFSEAAGNRLGPLAQCATRMGAGLRSASRSGVGHTTTGILANSLENAWNGQDLQTRAELSAISPLNGVLGARAPQKVYFAPMTSHRLHAYDLGEIRWLRALAERARAEAPADKPENALRATDSEAELRREIETVHAVQSDVDPDEIALGKELAELERAAAHRPQAMESRPGNGSGAAGGPDDVVAALDMTALEAQIRAETIRTFTFGSDPYELVLDEQSAGLERAAKQLPSPVRRRLGECYGIGVMQALTSLQDSREAGMARAEIEADGFEQRAPRWIEELAVTLLADTGARTREGLRTGSLRLDPAVEPDTGYFATEIDTGIQGHLTIAGLVEQMQLSLWFAGIVWSGLAALQNAGKEGGWTLMEGEAGNAEFAATDRATLEAAQQIEGSLGRVRHANSQPDRLPSAVEQAALTAEALTAVGPTVRAAAGWPGAAAAPNARNPDDVARIAAVAESLQGEVKRISNRLIAGRMAGSEAYVEAGDA